MLFLHRVPKLLRWIFSVALFLLIVMTIARLLVYFEFNPPDKAFSGSAFIMGLRYDARVVSIVGIIIMLLCAIPLLNPFNNYKAKTFWNIFLPVLFLILVIILAIDFYHFDYLHQRLNATVLNYLEDAGISFNMMWQSYPLLKISIGFILLFFCGSVHLQSFACPLPAPE